MRRMTTKSGEERNPHVYELRDIIGSASSVAFTLCNALENTTAL